MLCIVVVSMTILAFNLGRNEPLLRRLVASPLSLLQSSKETISAKDLKNSLQRKTLYSLTSILLRGK